MIGRIAPVGLRPMYAHGAGTYGKCAAEKPMGGEIFVGGESPFLELLRLAAARVLERRRQRLLPRLSKRI
jgi:hypothetical protein